MHLRNTPANERGGERKGKASSASVFSLMLIIQVVCAFLILLFIYLPSFQQPVCRTFQKASPRSPSLYFFMFLLYTRLFLEAKLTRIVDPSSMCKYSSNILSRALAAAAVTK